MAQNGCGKFQPTNAPTAIQNSVSNMMSLLCYTAGNDNGGPDGLPVVGGTGDPTPYLKSGPLLPSPPLFTPAIFSCVRPYAAMPNTAPMAKWNKPAPCKVNGCH